MSSSESDIELLSENSYSFETSEEDSFCADGLPLKKVKTEESVARSSSSILIVSGSDDDDDLEENR